MSSARGSFPLVAEFARSRSARSTRDDREMYVYTRHLEERKLSLELWMSLKDIMVLDSIRELCSREKSLSPVYSGGKSVKLPQGKSRRGVMLSLSLRT